MIPGRQQLLVALALLALAGCKPSVRYDVPVPHETVRPKALAPAPDSQTKADTALRGEAHLFKGTEPVATIFPVHRVLRIYSYDGQGHELAYAENQDWQLTNGMIRRTEGSRIPDFATYRYSAQKGCDQGILTRACAMAIACLAGVRSCPPSTAHQFDFIPAPRNPPLTIGHNVYVDYVSAIPAPLIKAKPGGFQHARAVICVGDSLTAGAHTIARYFHDRDDDSWCALLRRNLPGVRFENRGQTDTSADAIIGQVERSSIKPDSVIIAFGMNDHVQGKAGLKWFTDELTRAIVDLKKRGIRIMLVGFFQQNGLWVGERPADTVAYNQTIEKLAQRQGVPFIDVRPAFDRLSGDAPPGEQFTADFMHHPNLYGQRIYFSLIVPHFISEDRSSSTMSDYVIGAE